MSLPVAKLKIALDAAIPAGTYYVAYSVNGTTEDTTIISARTSITTGVATSADPSVIANTNAVESIASVAGGTVYYRKLMTALTNGTDATDWVKINGASGVTVDAGGKVTIAIGDLTESLRSVTD